MNRLDINLARRPFTNDTLLLFLLGALLGLSLGLTGWNAYRFMSTGSQVAALSDQREALEKHRRDAEQEERRLRRTLEKSRNELLASRATFANTLIQSHNFSWTKLFNELEQVMPKGMRLVSIRPRVEDGIWIQLDGMARDNESFWELQERLENWPVFGNVYPDLVQSANVRQGLNHGELMVSLETEYLPDAREHLGLERETPDKLAERAGAAGPVPAGPASPSATEGVPAQEAAENAGETDAKAPVALNPTLVESSPDAVQPPEAVVPEAENGPENPPESPARDRKETGTSARRNPVIQGARSPVSVNVGVHRLRPFPQGPPGFHVPDIKTYRPPATPEDVLLPDLHVTPGGQLVDEEGRKVDVQDLLQNPAAPKVLPPAEPDQEKGQEESQGPAAGESDKKRGRQ
ncbi:MAG: PilN domain-containing protein [Acidobacteriota bacterium]